MSGLCACQELPQQAIRRMQRPHQCHCVAFTPPPCFAHRAHPPALLLAHHLPVGHRDGRRAGVGHIGHRCLSTSKRPAWLSAPMSRAFALRLSGTIHQRTVTPCRGSDNAWEGSVDAEASPTVCAACRGPVDPPARTCGAAPGHATLTSEGTSA